MDPVVKVALISAGSALTGALLGKLFDALAYKRKRKDSLADREAEKEEKEDSKVLSEIKQVRAEIAEVKGDVAEVKGDVADLRSELKTVKDEAEEGRVVEMRIRILRFADELSHGEPKHSKDHFQQILEDCKCYEAYVDPFSDSQMLICFFRSNTTSWTTFNKSFL